jgi:transcriptional regulator with XRE-family HTH domain
MAKNPQRPEADLAREREWSRRLTSTVGARVRLYRDEKHANLSAKELADRCEKLGYRVEQQVIANMEGGRRTGVNLAEILVLALALDVPPLLLLVPIGGPEEIELLPNAPTSPQAAYAWIVGRAPFARRAGERSDGTPRYRVNLDVTDTMLFAENAERIKLYDQHAAAIEEFDKLRTWNAEAAGRVLDELVRIRRELAAEGLDVPGLYGLVGEAVAAQEGA